MHTIALLLLALLAQTTPDASDAAAKERAQALVDEGSALFEAGELPAALEKFNAAYAVFPSPKILFNVGQANRELGRPVEAVKAYEGFLAGVPDAEPGLTADAHRALAELQAQLGRVRIDCGLPGAELSLDGMPVGRSPLSELLWTTPGHHQVAARHPRAIPVLEDLDVSAGEVHTVVLTLAALPEVITPLRATAPEPRPSGLWLGRTWTWVAAGSAVVLAGGATGFGLAMQSRFDDLKKKCGAGAGPDWPGCSDGDLQGLDRRKTAANVLWAASAASAAAAGVLFFVEGRSATVAPLAGPANGVQLAVRF